MALKRSKTAPDQVVDKGVKFQKSPLSVPETVEMAKLEKKRFRKLKITSGAEPIVVPYIEVDSPAMVTEEPEKKVA